MTEKAQVGDLIRIIKENSWTSVGDIGEVFEVYADGTGVSASFPYDGDVPIGTSEYVIHRKAGEEDDIKEAVTEILKTPPGKTLMHDDYGVPYTELTQADPVFDGLFDERLPSLPSEEVDKIIRKEETQADRIKRAGTELTELLVRKNHDYGDSFAKQYEKYGLMSALIRMDDKIRRLETLLDGKDSQVDESIKDTLLDLAGYALLASVEASKRQGGKA